MIHRLSVAVSRARWVSMVLPGLLVALGLLAPLLVFASQGVSLVGLSEESTGYRYFYSLRTLLTADERPRLPQGQVVTLVHFALHLALTWLGHPPSQISPRIEIFAYAGAALPHIATGLALVWAVRPLRSLGARLALAAAVVVAAHDRAFSGFHLVIPDYYSWIHTAALLSLGCCLRLTDVARGSSPAALSVRRWVLGLGLLVGASLALKPTLVPFLLPPLLLLYWRLGGRISGARVVATALVLGIATFFTIIWLAYAGSISRAVFHFTSLVRFGVTQGAAFARDPTRELLADLLLSGSLMVPLSVGLALLLVASAMVMRDRYIALILLPGSLLSLAIAWVRPMPTTWIEVSDYVILAGTVWLVRVGAPALRAWTVGAVVGLHSRLGHAMFACVLVVLAAYRAHVSVEVLSPSFLEVSVVQEAVNRFMDERPGRTAIFTLSNAHRPMTYDGAIFKGGTNSGESSVWGSSPFVAQLAPDRHYYLTTPDLSTPVDLSPYEKVQFVSLQGPERMDITLGRLSEAFGISLLGFECPLQVVRQVAGGVHYGCQRRPDAPIHTYQGEIAFIQDAMALSPETPVEHRVGPARPLDPGAAVYSQSTGEIWRLDADGLFTRLVGSVGQEIVVGALGEWSDREQALGGAPAIFDGARWSLPAVAASPINRNATFRLQDDASIRGWQVLSRDGVSVDRVEPAGAQGVEPGAEPGTEDAADGWLELRARKPSTVLGVRATVNVSRLQGAPLVASVQARGLGTGNLVVRLAPIDESATSRTASRRTHDERGWSTDVEPDGTWQTLSLAIEPGRLDADQVELVIEFADAAPGDKLDLQRAEILAGRFPRILGRR